MADVQRTVIVSEQAPQPLGAYSVGMAASPGRLVYVAGQVSVDTGGNVVGAGDVSAQTKQAFRNIGGVLAAVGGSFSDIVEFTTYVVGQESVQGFIDGRTEIYPEIFPDGDYPPNTLLVISGLVREEFLVEIKAVAVLP